MIPCAKCGLQATHVLSELHGPAQATAPPAAKRYAAGAVQRHLPRGHAGTLSFSASFLGLLVFCSLGKKPRDCTCSGMVPASGVRAGG